jgi:hypothetical protein
MMALNKEGAYIMHALTLPAHFDGKQILLDVPFELEPNAKLIVTILPKQKEEDGEREAWLRLSLQGLASAYDENEVEYTQDMIKKPNPDYDKRR